MPQKYFKTSEVVLSMLHPNRYLAAHSRAPSKSAQGGASLWESAASRSDLPMVKKVRARQEAKIRHVYEEAVMSQKINAYNRKTHSSQ